MIKHKQIQKLKDQDFKRETGIKKETFECMKKLIIIAEQKKKEFGGKPHVLCIEDRILMTLEYMREYRTYFHIGNSYGISESACWRNCTWIEDQLIKSKKFSLPGRKSLQKSEIEFEIVLIDGSESPIERPKRNRVKNGNKIKNRKNLQKKYYSGKKNDIQKKPK